MVPEPALIERFRSDLDSLVPAGGRIGIAVSGGPDSLALLLLAQAARPGLIEAATVDHGLRDESGAEAAMVAETCDRLAVPHAILTPRWAEAPRTAIQERARHERYRLLGFWAEERGLAAIATGHHADDQAETFVMRLARGAGVRGLAGMRRRSVAPGTETRLIRPLLDWRRSELAETCVAAGIVPVSDPSNEDEGFERIRIRRALAGAEWLDPQAVARSAANLGDADSALDWAMRKEWRAAVQDRGGAFVYQPGDAPREIVRRLVSRAVRKLASEGDPELRGRELDRLLAELADSGEGTIRGVRYSGGSKWVFSAAPQRRRRS